MKVINHFKGISTEDIEIINPVTSDKLQKYADLFYELRKEKGMKVPAISYHLVFTGNPGTGKTTIARLIAQIIFS